MIYINKDSHEFGMMMVLSSYFRHNPSAGNKDDDMMVIAGVYNKRLKTTLLANAEFAKPKPTLANMNCPCSPS
jgi:hypothetical protein